MTRSAIHTDLLAAGEALQDGDLSRAEALLDRAHAALLLDLDSPLWELFYGAMVLAVALEKNA